MSNVGNRLKKAREKQGFTLDDAQKSLKIHPSILKALEEENAEQFLSPVYVRSFLRSYARYLGLDAEKLVGDYVEKHPEEAEQVLYVGPKKRIVGYIKKYMPMAAKIVAALLILIIITAITTNVVKFIKVRIAKRPQRIETIKPHAAVLEKPTIDIPQNQPLNLIVKTNDAVWMDVKSDGKIIFRGVLPAGSVETWNAKEQIELETGRAHALELILNGIPLGSPGRGVKRGILITHKGMKLP